MRIMAESLEQGYDPEKTVVVSNFPADIGEEELTIHFQKEKNGGGDVGEAMVDGSVAFVVFDFPEGLEHFYKLFLDCFNYFQLFNQPFTYVLYTGTFGFRYLPPNDFAHV